MELALSRCFSQNAVPTTLFTLELTNHWGIWATVWQRESYKLITKSAEN